VCALRERERELHLQLVCLQNRVLENERRRRTVVRFFKAVLQEDKVKCFVFPVVFGFAYRAFQEWDTEP
jgi:hypothetical protein